MERGTLYVGGTYRFTVECFNSSGAVVALDGEPTFVVVKNGTPTADAVTAVDRNSDGKHYDCTYTPSGAVETDHYEIRVTVEIGGTPYVRPSEHFDVKATERGTNNAYTGTPPTIEEIAGEVWSAATRSLTDKADFGLSAAAISAIEASLVNEGDSTALLQAIADKIAGDLTAGDLSALAIVSAIKSDATLAQMIARIDADVSSRLATGSYVAPLNAADTRAAIGLASANLDTQLNSISTAIGGISTGGSDWSNDEKTVIRNVLGIPASGTTPDTPTTGALFDIKEVVDDLPTVEQIRASTPISPLAAGDEQLVVGTKIRIYRGMTKTHTISPITDANGNNVNLVGKTLEVIIDTYGAVRHTDLEVLAVTVNSAASISFTNTTLSTLVKPGLYKWACREPSNGNYVWARGVWEVEDTATKDS